jgi:hypothetical protein
MCFGRAIWLGRSLSRNRLQGYCSAIAYHCGFAAYRKPPLVNTLASDYPIHQTVLLQKRRNSYGIGARYCDALCAAMMTQFLYILRCSFRSGVAAVGRNCARASCTSWCGDTRGLCVQKWFGLGDECTRLSFEQRGAVLWTDPPATVWTSVANCCHLRAGCSRTVRMGWCKTSGKVKLV